MPLGHESHSVAPTIEYVPGPHGKQAVDPAEVEKDPSSHGVQDDNDVAPSEEENVPGGHKEQLPLPAVAA